MIKIDIETASSNKIAALFQNFPINARRQLVEAMHSITDELEALVIGAEPFKTGQLRAATASFVDDTDDKIAGKVRITGPSGSQIFAKAAALEYGAHVPTKVRAHAQRRSAVFGHYFGPVEALVTEYQRIPDIAEHGFLRGPLAALQGSIFEQLDAALQRAAGESGA